MIVLPEKEYVQVEENGKMVCYCTMRQKVLHTIGLDHSYGKVYTRHNKRFYKPYRNYFAGKDVELDKLVAESYMDCEDAEDENKCIYSLTPSGLDWLSGQLNIHIYEEE